MEEGEAAEAAAAPAAGRSATRRRPATLAATSRRAPRPLGEKRIMRQLRLRDAYFNGLGNDGRVADERPSYPKRPDAPLSPASASA